MPMVRPRGTGRGTEHAPYPGMTTSLPIQRQARAFAIAHESVCLRCGHGESLHPMRELACLVCDQRASAGLRSDFCVGFLSDRAASASAVRGH